MLTAFFWLFNCQTPMWNDSEDTVYLYLLKKDDRDCYTVENKMISESLTKKDVEGKEEGVLKK